MSHATALKEALRTRGIPSPEAFAQRYGVALDTLTVDKALRLLVLPDHPRERDRAMWAPIQRRTYTIGLVLALATLRRRLERGQIVLADHPGVATELHWLRLATRAVRLIARLARADRDVEAAFLDSELGRWYATLDWPEASEGARLMDWAHHPARSRSPPSTLAS